MRTGVTVTGTGSVSVRPDLARSTLTLQARGADVAGALDAASGAMADVLTALRERGVADHDVAADGISVHEARTATGEINGFQCSQQIRVTVRDVAGAGAVLRAAATAGGDRLRINDVHLDVGDRTAAAEQARAAAFADARARAEQYAALAGRALGTVASIDEQLGPTGPVFGAVRLAAAHSAPAVPVPAGAQDVIVSVTVRWTLLD